MRAETPRSGRGRPARDPSVRLLAELQARTYHESQDKPTYAIREIVEATAERAEPTHVAGTIGSGPRELSRG